MGGSCDHRNGKCHYGNWYGKEVESAVAFNGHTDDACTQNSQCRQYPRGSCDHRNGKCHYGNWYGKEDAVGAYCWEFAGKKAECEATPGCKYFDNLGFCNSGSDHYRESKEVATSDPMYWWNMAFATPSSSVTAGNFVVYGFSIIGFGAVVYGAAQHFLKKSSGDAVYEEV